MSAGGGPNEPFDWTRPTPPGSGASPGTGAGYGQGAPPPPSWAGGQGGPVAPGGAGGSGGYGSPPAGGGGPWQPTPPRRGRRAVWVILALIISLPGLVFIILAGVCFFAATQGQISPEEQAAKNYDALRSLPTIDEVTDRNDRLVQEIHAMLAAKYQVGPLTSHGETIVQPCVAARFDAQVRASGVSSASPGVPAESWAQVQQDIAAVVRTEGFWSRDRIDATPTSVAYYWHPTDVSAIWVRGYPDFKIAWRSSCHLTAAGKAAGTPPPTTPPQPASTPFPRDGDLWPGDRLVTRTSLPTTPVPDSPAP